MPVPLAAVVMLRLVSVVVPVVLRISKAMPVAPVLLTLVMVVFNALTMTSLALPANVTLLIVVLVDGVISTPAVRKFRIVMLLIMVPDFTSPSISLSIASIKAFGGIPGFSPCLTIMRNRIMFLLQICNRDFGWLRFRRHKYVEPAPVKSTRPEIYFCRPTTDGRIRSAPRETETRHP